MVGITLIHACSENRDSSALIHMGVSHVKEKSMSGMKNNVSPTFPVKIPSKILTFTFSYSIQIAQCQQIFIILTMSLVICRQKVASSSLTPHSAFFKCLLFLHTVLTLEGGTCLANCDGLITS